MNLRARLLSLALTLGAAGPLAATDFSDVAPILAGSCVRCHSGPSAPMGLELTSYDKVLAGGWTGPVVRAGDPDSALLHRLKGAQTPRMPLNGPPYLGAAEVAVIESWIMAGLKQGAPVAEAAARPRPAPGAPVLWPDIEPILGRACVRCHSDGTTRKGGPPEDLRLSSLKQVLAGGDRVVILPGNPEMSDLWRRVAGLSPKPMPLDGPPFLPAADVALIREWIAQGAKDAKGRPAKIPVGERIRLRGKLTGKYEIDGAPFVVDAGTDIEDRPRIGAQAEMRGVVQADGTVRATRFRAR